MTRVLLFFLAVMPLGAFSALQWIYRYTFHRSTMNPEDRARVEHCFGILDPRLEPIWQNLFHGTAQDRRLSYHLWKDVLSEWVKLDAQRGGKFLSMIAGFWFVVAVVAIEVAVWE